MVTQRFVSFYESEPSPSLSVIVHNGEELSVSSMSLNRPVLRHRSVRQVPESNVALHPQIDKG